MAELVGARLDEAYDALRAWCHERPDLRDPSTSYGAFGAITAIIATLEHIVDLVSRSATRATGTDDERSVTEACEEVSRHTCAAMQSFEDAYRAIAGAHGVTGHLVFAVVHEGLATRAARPDTA